MSITRIAYSAESRKSAVAVFEADVVAELKARADKARKTLEIAQRFLPAAPSPEFDSNAAYTAAALLIEEARRLPTTAVRAEGRPQPLSITTGGGLIVAVPPYDFAYLSLQGASNNFSDPQHGTFRIDCGFAGSGTTSQEYAAGGIGLFATSTIEQDVRFSADAQFQSRWGEVVWGGGVQAQGGVGVIVYEGGNTIARTDALLWSEVAGGSVGHTHDDSVFLTQTSAGQTYFHMLSGRTYQIWIWAWAGAVSVSNGQGAYGFGVMDTTVPFMVLAQQ
jgi:hypothetical protein